MQDREMPSWAIRIFGPLLFLLGAVAALMWFVYSAFALFTGIASEVVVFDKGSFYMLGVGIGLLALAVAGIHETWLAKPLTKKTSSAITKIAVAGVVLTFTVPHIVHYISNNALQRNGYSVCNEASHQWLFVRNIIYIQDSIACSEELINK